MNEIFQEAEITITKENKKDIDRAIHGIVGIEYKNCSATWKEVKKKLAEDKENFVNALKNLK
jgi:phage-related protein